jgi:hypothetical protein
MYASDLAAGLHPRPFSTPLGWACDRLKSHGRLLTCIQYQSRERFAFAVSAAILITCLRERPSMVRGVFGRITNSVLN